MALNFPSSPTVGQTYTDSVSGFSYEWDGTVWKSYTPASSSNIKILDDISGSFNGIGKTFSLTSNSIALSPVSAQSLVINLGGVIQDPSDDYSVSSSNIIFSTAPASGLSFSGISLGPAAPITTIPDGTITDGSLVVSGNLSISGVVTAVTGSAVTYYGDGSQLSGISVGLTTEAVSGGLVTLDLSNQDHKVTATGITTITVTGGTEGDSHTVRIVNSGIATVGFSTYFLFPSGSPPSLPTADGTINLISFTVHRVGTAGTQLLAGAGLNYQ